MPFKTSAGSIFATALAFGGGGLGVLLTRGQATWVPQNHWLAPGLFSAAGVLTLWSVLLVLKSSSRVPSDPGRVGQTMGQPEVHGVGNAALAAGRDIHISYSTPVRAVPLHPGADKIPKAAAEAKSPNLQYVTSKEKRVFVSPLARDGVCDPRNIEEHEKSLQALVLKFENKIQGDRKIARAMNVIAKIRFRSTVGDRERVIDYGVWLNSPCNSTDMGTGDTRELLLMCVMDDGSLESFEDRREGSHQFQDEFSYIDIGCVDGLEVVEITLIDRNSQAILNCKFRVWRDGIRFCVALKD